MVPMGRKRLVDAYILCSYLVLILEARICNYVHTPIMIDDFLRRVQVERKVVVIVVEGGKWMFYVFAKAGTP
eukprot:SAG31_NODE_9282_length_1305_cov_1.114428_2_plen_72_part_00